MLEAPSEYVAFVVQRCSAVGSASAPATRRTASAARRRLLRRRRRADARDPERGLVPRRRCDRRGRRRGAATEVDASSGEALSRGATHRSSMRYKVVVEYDPETRHYTASVPGLPVFADAKTERSVLRLAREAIAFYRDETAGSPRSKRRAEIRAKVVDVEV
jgi:predicted RNase H-like HicB family nuclease